jgi:RNA polymerase sigma factor (sigma-70 family)
MENKPIESSGVIPLNNAGPAQNFGLSMDEFTVMLAQLEEGEDQLFEHIFLSHFDECCKYVSSKFGMEYENSYDITMDTMLEFRLKLLSGKISYGNLRYLFTRMASNNYVAQLGQNQRLKQILHTNDIEEIYHEERFDKLDQAWKRLDETERTVLTQFYYEDRSLKDIAESTQANDAAVRKKKQRAMDSLREAFFKIYKH